jgi:hypothetical protein
MQKINPTQFVIESIKNGTQTYFDTGLTKFTYYESILETSISSKIEFVDTGYRNNNSNTSATELDDTDIQGTEKVYLSFSDENGNKLNFNTDATALRIFRGNPVLFDTKKEILSFNLCTTEFLKKFITDYYVVGAYEGRISDSVNTILKSVLKTKKPVDIDPTINSLRFNGSIDWTVRDAIIWLAPKAVPNLPSAKGKTAGYFFYETSEGFKFKSIDILLGQSPKKKFIYTNTTGVPSGDYGKILAAPEFSSSVDALNLIRRGSYGSQLYVYDPVLDKVRPNNLTKEDQEKGIKKAGKTLPNFDSELQGTSSINFSYADKGHTSPGKNYEEQLSRSNEENLIVTEIINQSKMRYQQLFAIEASITIFADLTLHAGDMIECHFPEISSKKTQIISPKKSGLYMIVDLCHYISTNGPSYTRLNLVRDSYGRRIT